MISASGLLLILAKATVLFAVALVVDRTMLRRASAAVRHFAWTLTLLSVMVLPLLSTSLPGWKVVGVSTRTAPPVASVLDDVPNASASRSDSEDVSKQLRARRADDAPVRAPVAAAPATAPESVTPRWVRRASAPVVLSAVWIAIALLLLARIASERGQIRRISRYTDRITSGSTHDLVKSIARSFGIRRSVSLLQSRDTIMPVTWGVLRPHILVPSEFESWPEQRQRAVITHELAHVARHDCLTQIVAAMVCAAWWFHPAAWFAAHRLRVERELACDDRVLSAGMSPHEYARHLLEIARRACVPTPISTLAVNMATTSNLEKRMLAAIDRGRSRTSPGTAAKLFAVVVATAFLLPTAVLQARAEDTRSSTSELMARTPSRVVSSEVGRQRVHEGATPTTKRVVAAKPTVATSTFDSVRSVSESVAVSESREGGQWHMRPATSTELVAGQPSVHVMLITNGINTFVVKHAQLDGLPAELLSGKNSNASFRLVRAAGTLVFTGGFAGGKGSGSFEFIPDASFADALIQRGMSRPTARQQFSMGLHDVGLNLLDELKTHGYQQPTTELLTRVGLTSVDVQYIRDMAAIGYRLGSVGALIELTNHSLDAATITAMNARAGRTLTPRELVSLRQHGNASAEIPSARPVVTQPASPSSTVRPRPRTTPVNGRWVLRATRGAQLDIELQWDDDTQWRRTYAEVEFRGLSLQTVLSPISSSASFGIEQDAGRFVFEGSVQGGQGSGPFRFIVNRTFIDTLRALGIQADDVTDHDLKNLAYGRISAAAVREFQAMGFSSIDARELVEAAIFGASPAFARAVRAAAMEGSETVSGIASLRHAGVPTEFVAGLAELGYRKLSADDVKALARGGVTIGFVRQLHDAGTRNLTVDELIERRKR